MAKSLSITQYRLELDACVMKWKKIVFLAMALCFYIEKPYW